MRKRRNISSTRNQVYTHDKKLLFWRWDEHPVSICGARTQLSGYVVTSTFITTPRQQKIALKLIVSVKDFLMRWQLWKPLDSFWAVIAFIQLYIYSRLKSPKKYRLPGHSVLIHCFQYCHSRFRLGNRVYMVSSYKIVSSPIKHSISFLLTALSCHEHDNVTTVKDMDSGV